MKKILIVLAMLIGMSFAKAQTASFYYCGQDVDLWGAGFWTTDGNASYGFYKADVVEWDTLTNTAVATIGSYTYAAGDGGPGGPALGLLTGIIPDRIYQITYSTKMLSTDPWSSPGTPCLFHTINTREFYYCGYGSLNINAYGTQAGDNNVAYNYYRFEFSLDNTFSEHTTIGSPLSNKYSIELDPSNKSSSLAPPLDQVLGLQYSKAYYARVRVKINATDAWSTPGPACTFTTYCPGSGPYTPIEYWQMEHTTPGGVCYSNIGYNVVLDEIRGQEMAYDAYLAPGPVGNCKVETMSTCNFRSYSGCSSYSITPHLSSGFTFEFLVKPDRNNLMSGLAIDFGSAIGYPYIGFSQSGFNFSVFDVSNQEYAIGTRLGDYPGIYSFDYFLDGNFHHIAYIYDGTNQTMQIWIDGVHPTSSPIDNIYFDFNGTLPSQVNFWADFITNGAGITSCQWDEVAVYDQALPPEMIYQHYVDFTRGNHYNYCTNYTSSDIPAQPVPGCSDLSYNEKAPMNSSGTFSVSASDQLKSYPLPRYNNGFSMRRNVNYTDLSQYFSADYSQSGSLFGVAAFDMYEPFEIDYEMFKNWNYYYHVEGPTNISSDPAGTLPYEQAASYMVTQANTLTDIDKISTTTLWPFVVSSGYSAPSSLNDSIPADTDGVRQAHRINDNLLNYMSKPLDYIVDNAEAYNACGSALTITSAVASAVQYAVESKYKGEILNPSNYASGNQSKINNTEFSIYRHYDVDFGTTSNVCEYASWLDVRPIVQMNDGTRYSTEDLYTVPSSWYRGGYAASHGLYSFLESRAYEVSANDKFCAPFVNAGFSSPDVDMRASQYLGLLKAYSLAGAEYFHAAYFNVTDVYGNYATGTTVPNDPRGYIYQFVMPSYAQAITTKYDDIFRNGALENAYGGTFTPPQLFVGGNRIILARKRDSQNIWAITGSMQRQNNCLNLVADEDVHTINLGGNDITFKIRRQGSTYVYDNSGANPVFYQLDGWHENTHPYYWDKNFNFEAELFDNTSSSAYRKTEVPTTATAGDYTDFTTFVKFPNSSSSIDFYFTPRNPSLSAPSSSDLRTYYVWVRARATAGNTSSIDVDFTGLGTNTLSVEIPCIDDSGFQWYNFGVPGGSPGGTSTTTFTLSANEVYNNKITFTGNTTVEIDKIIISEDATPANIPSGEIAAQCATNRMASVKQPAAVAQSIAVYPNPNKGQFTIVLNEYGEDGPDISLMNALGETVYSARPALKGKNEFTINTSGLIDGVYFLMVKTDKGVAKSRVLIIK